MRKLTGSGKHPVHVTPMKAIVQKIDDRLSLCHIDDPDADNTGSSDSSDHETL